MAPVLSRLIKSILWNTLILSAATVAISFIPESHASIPELALVQQFTLDSWTLLRPGGKWHPSYFIEHHGHLVLEGFLLLVISYLLIQRSATVRTGEQERPLSDKEVDELCNEWEPEPLAGPVTEFQRMWLDDTPILTTHVDRLVNIMLPKSRKHVNNVINMAAFDFLGLSHEESISHAAKATIQKYGVGSCGPRGFYGTVDVHLELEHRLAKFMGTQEAILYSYDLATVPSIIPAFANRKDLIIIDEGCAWALHNGCLLSRARVITFKHNDTVDLERILKAIAKEDQRSSKPLNRRFIVVEGIYAYTGEIAPLQDIARLKNRYKYRLLVDESISFCVLGKHGRGAADAAGLTPDDVDIVGSSLGNAVASVGGFCSGDREIVDHQRLSGLGYCFSASLPPYLASAAVAALDIIEKDGKERMMKVQQLAAQCRERLRASLAALPSSDTSNSDEYFKHLRVMGDIESDLSPLIHVQAHPLPPQKTLWDEGDGLLYSITRECLQRDNVLFEVSKYSAALEGEKRPPPSIRVAISAAHTPSDIEKAVSSLVAAYLRVVDGAKRGGLFGLTPKKK